MIKKIFLSLVLVAILFASYSFYVYTISFKTEDVAWANCSDHQYAGQNMKCEFGLSPKTNLTFVDKLFTVSIYDKGGTKIQNNQCQIGEGKVVVCEDISTTNIKSMLSKLTLDLGNESVFDTTFKTLYPLQKGVNITRWFRYGDKNESKYLYYMSQNNLAEISQLGFDHVRLPLEVTEFYNNPKTFDYLGLAINKILDSGMAVVVDAHSQSLNKELETSPEARKQYKLFWSQLANFLKNFDEQRVILELYNEPIFANDDKAWSDYQMELYSTVRAIAPNHTIVLTGNNSSNINSMTNIELPKDKNVILDLHYYNRLVYTHQGVDFAADYLKEVNGLKYPYDPENCKKIQAEILSQEAKEAVGKYCEIKINNEYQDKNIKETLQPILDSGNKIWIGEFGSYSCQKDITNPVTKQEIRSSKIQFLQDTTKTFKDLNIPWAVWGWDDCFGLDAKKVGDNFQYDKEYYDAIIK